MMASSPSELSLECKPAAQSNYSMLLKSFGDHQPAAAPAQPTPGTAAAASASDQHPMIHEKLEEYLARLEEERLKIDAFKRELPLCMQLLTNAMETSRQQLQSYKLANQAAGTCPVLEEFIPLKQPDNNNSGEGEADQKLAVANQRSSDHKANWMTSAQLWSCSQASNNDHEYGTKNAQPNEITDISLSLDHHNKQQRNGGGGGGAFVPFTKERNIGTATTGPAAADHLALASSTDKQMDHDNNYCRSESINDINQGIFLAGSRGEIHEGKVVGNRNNKDMTQTSTRNGHHATATATNTAATTQTNRKQRRCWSPDLHRRFVNALQMLGGSQVATPKQIRELMKVDGLTNDEVKSHLQKYRLHTRRPSPSPQLTAAGSPAPQLFVLASSIWVPPEYAAAANGGAPTIYSPHPTSQVSPHYCTSPVPQELIHHPPHSLIPQPQVSMHHHPIIHQHQQLHVYNKSTKTASQQVHSSADDHSDGGGGGDRSESIDEDGNKSESSSWKGESGGENGGDVRRKRVATDEESNGSEITLKF